MQRPSTLSSKSLIEVFSNEDSLLERALQIIESYFERVSRPLYLGYLSLEVGWSLDRTKQMLDVLQDRGVVRLLHDSEKTQYGFPQRAIVYGLTKRLGPV